MKTWLSILLISTAGLSPVSLRATVLPYPIVDTAQVRCYDARGETAFPKQGSAFHGQDANYRGREPAYRDNRDGTVTDLNTGLMWQQDPGTKRSYDAAVAGAARCTTGGYRDWRLPSIKELYSLIRFDGTDPDPSRGNRTDLTPFIDANVFAFSYGKEADGDRIIDAQYATSTRYVSTTMGGNDTMFGVNFADGRIKGYPTAERRRGQKLFYTLYVRSNPAYGNNHLRANGDGTVTDAATGLIWSRVDSGRGMTWQEALAYAESLELAGHTDWRLPTAKELQSIVDYTRAPDTTGSAAIDPVFRVTAIRNERGDRDYPSYWTGTTHVRAGGRGSAAVTLAFGRAMGYMQGRWMDVHGAGAQRSDPKDGDAADYPTGRGPQGDAIRILNYVRCVRGGAVEPQQSGPARDAPQTADPPPSPRPRSNTGEPPAGRPPSFVRRLDRDGDGKVSRHEFDGPAHHFRKLDRNRDGYLTEAEAPPPPRGNARPPRH